MDKKLVVIPFNVPWVWSTDYLNQTAFELANKNYEVVCFLWEDKISLSKPKSWRTSLKVSDNHKNIHLFRPVNIVPFIRFNFVVKANQILNLAFLRLYTEYISLRNNINNKIFWIFDPNLLFMYKYFGKNYYLLYDCVDFFAVGDKNKISQTVKNEKDLCRTADLVTANSVVLHRHLTKYRKNVGLVPQGFRLDGFVVRKDKYINLKLKFPVIGFVGGINNRLETSILYPLIKNNPKWNFVLWGPTQNLDTGSDRFDEINKILKLPNVTTGESRDKDEIPGLVSQFDIGIIPYDIKQDFNKNCYPMKLFEFFYLKIPVISTPITELKRFPDLVKLCNSYKDWEAAINQLLTKPLNTNLLNKEKKLAVDNSWEEKVRQITDLIN